MCQEFRNKTHTTNLGHEPGYCLLQLYYKMLFSLDPQQQLLTGSEVYSWLLFSV
jgi:hypothetical protein